MELGNLIKLDGNRRSNKRVGRGIGSGKGCHCSGKGNKGQKARKGAKPWPGFEGGQVPLFKRLPQIGGFNNHNAKKIINVSLSLFNLFEDGTEVTPKLLVEKGLLGATGKCKVKILGNGDLSKKLSFKEFVYSESAKSKIEKADSKIL